MGWVTAAGCGGSSGTYSTIFTSRSLVNPKVFVHIQIAMPSLRRAAVRAEEIERRRVLQSDCITLELDADSFGQIDDVLLKLKRLGAGSG